MIRLKLLRVCEIGKYNVNTFRRCISFKRILKEEKRNYSKLSEDEENNLYKNWKYDEIVISI